jgi:hypothetical protein
MSNIEDIEYQHFIDKTASIIELVQVHLMECPIIQEETDILKRVTLIQNLLVEIKNDVKQIKTTKLNQNES